MKIKKLTLYISLVFMTIITSVSKANAESEFASGNGVAGDPFIIKTVEQLENVSKYCGSKYQNIYFKLGLKSGGVLDASSLKNSICNDKDNVFYGGFDGNGAEIKITLKTSKEVSGLFGNLKNARVKNLSIAKLSTISGKNNVGGFANVIEASTLTNVYNKAKINGNNNIGGIAAIISNSTLSEIFNSGIVNSTGYNAGGIAGGLYNNTITNTKNKSTISAEKDDKGNSYVGGIGGFVHNNTIIDVVNDGEIKSTGAYIGGIGGNISYSKILNVKNTGKILAGKNSEGNSFAGGVAGALNYMSSITNIYNEGEIISEGSQVGGVSGVLASTTISQIKNIGSISAKNDSEGYSFVGGVVGNSDSSTISEALNKGTINGIKSHVGGIIGYSSNTKITYAKNKGSITAGKDPDGESLVGGIIGYCDETTMSETLNTGKIVGNGNIIGLVVGRAGKNSIIKNSYTKKETDDINGFGQTDDKVITENIKGYTNDELFSQSNYINFDFENIWAMSHDGYAGLKNIETDENKKVIVKYDSYEININNYLYKGRTYVDIYDFCSKTGDCSAEKTSIYCFTDNDGKEKCKDTKEVALNFITDESKITEKTGVAIIKTEVVNNKEYKYKIIHVKNTKAYYPQILIGGRIINEDLGLNLVDQISCPESEDSEAVDDFGNKIISCSDKELFVPIRFLVQALGKTVSWNGEIRTVNINSNMAETFKMVYEMKVMSSGNLLLPINDEYQLHENQTAEIVFNNKLNNTPADIKSFLAFNVENINDNNIETIKLDKSNDKENNVYKYTDKRFEIFKNTIKLISQIEGSSQINIVAINKIVSDNNSEGGNYPVVLPVTFSYRKTTETK